MSDSDPPPSGGHEEGDSVSPASPRSKESRRRGVIPEILKRAVELGVEKARESPENLKSFVGDMKLPKEIAHVLFTQIDETKNGLFRVVAKEIRDFLENTNISNELQKVLTTVQFEVNTTIRFTPNDGRDKKKKAAEKDKSKKEAAAKDPDVIYESESTVDLSDLAGDDEGPESQRERKKRGKSP
jgi:hypothetical protein